MKVLLTGSTGFIGQRLQQRLIDDGHEVVCVGRREPPHAAQHPRLSWRRLDFSQATHAADWAPLLRGCDAVVNTVGIFREEGEQRFDLLHTQAPCALFEACAEEGVGRVVQLSALGADAQATTDYHLSKRAADDCLLSLPVDAVVVQPSLVYGPGGTSAAVFLSLASLPVFVLPGGGRQALQPVHVDDAVQALAEAVQRPAADLQALGSRRVALVGPRPLSLAEYLQALRHGLGLPRAPVIALPNGLATGAARLGDRLPHSLFDSASWSMLQRGNAAPSRDTAVLLGHAPRDPSQFIPHEQADAVRVQAQLRWLLPVLRLSMALVWLLTAVVSAGVYPVADSLELLRRTGVPGPLQPLALYGAAALDAVLGVLTLWPVGRGRWALPSRRWVWWVQAALMLVYMVIIAVRLPEFWIHPYAPLLKNLPMLAVLLLLDTFEPRSLPRRITR